MQSYPPPNGIYEKNRDRKVCFGIIEISRYLESFFIFVSIYTYTFTMKKEVYLIPECEEVIIKMENCIMSGGDQGGGDDLPGEDG